LRCFSVRRDEEERFLCMIDAFGVPSGFISDILTRSNRATWVCVDYMENIGLDAIEAHEKDLLEYATAKVSAIDGLRIIGQADEKAGILSFNLGDVHPHDVGTILDQEGIAVRAGHHCAQPVLERLGVQATVRASFALYNTRSEIDRLVEGIGKVGEVFS